MGWIKYLFHSITKKIFIYNFYVIYFAFLFCFGGQVDIISLHPNETTMKIRHCSFLCKWEKLKFSSGWNNYFSHSIFNENLLCESTTLTPWRVKLYFSTMDSSYHGTGVHNWDSSRAVHGYESFLSENPKCGVTCDTAVCCILLNYFLLVWWLVVMMVFDGIFVFSVILIYIKNSGYYNF